jgi:hypothetical protein
MEKSNNNTDNTNFGSLGNTDNTNFGNSDNTNFGNSDNTNFASLNNTNFGNSDNTNFASLNNTNFGSLGNIDNTNFGSLGNTDNTNFGYTPVKSTFKKKIGYAAMILAILLFITVMIFGFAVNTFSIGLNANFIVLISLLVANIIFAILAVKYL